MKKLIFIPLLLSLCFVSCKWYSDGSKALESVSTNISKDEVVSDYLHKLIEAIDNKDQKTIKSLISYKIKYSDSDISGLINLFASDPIIETDYHPLSGATKENYHYGKCINSFYYLIDITTQSHKKYILNYEICYVDDYYQRNEGFLYIAVYEENNEEAIVLIG